MLLLRILKAIPTEAQKEAGNYKKRKIRFHGMTISIENEKDSYRSGVDESGRAWKSKMHYAYGYINGTKGADKDHLDVFLGPDKDSEIVFVINQVNPKTKVFDEHKVMLGFDNEEEAKKAYLKCYEKGWDGLGEIHALTMKQFKEWLAKKGERREFRSNQVIVNKAQAILTQKIVPVHGKHGIYMAKRNVKVEDDSNHGKFSLMAEKQRKNRIQKMKEKPIYRVRAEDSSVGNLITGIKNVLIKNSQDEKAKEFVNLAYIAETVQDIYDIAKDFVSLKGKAEHRNTMEDEHDLFAHTKSAFYLLLKAKKAVSGEVRHRKDGDYTKKGEGKTAKWVKVPKKKEPKPKAEVKEKKPKKVKVKEAVGSTATEPIEKPIAPTSLPFNQIQRIEQYTAEKDYDKNQILDLKNSIKENGYQRAFPIQVDHQDGKWTIVSGHHRHEAVKQLIEEGHLPEHFQIPVVTREFATENDRLTAQVSENQRRTVLPTDEAKAYRKMRDNGWTDEVIAKKLGKPLGDVRKCLALTNLAPDLFSLVAKKDKALPVSIGQVIGMNAVNDDGSPNKTIQTKAFTWYQENKPKLGSTAPAQVESYIKELRSQDFGWNAEDTASDVQKEAIRVVGNAEKAKRNANLLDNMMKSLQKSYQAALGSSIADLNPSLVKELAASLMTTGNIQASKTLGTLEAIIMDLKTIKDNLSSQMKAIEGDAQTPMMFAMKSKFAELEKLENAIMEKRLELIANYKYAS